MWRTSFLKLWCPGCVKPPEKFLGDGVSTPMPHFRLICTIISNKTCILDQYQKTNFEWAGVDTSGRVRHPPYSKKFFVRRDLQEEKQVKTAGLFRVYRCQKSPIISGSFAENDLHLKARHLRRAISCVQVSFYGYVSLFEFARTVLQAVPSKKRPI